MSIENSWKQINEQGDDDLLSLLQTKNVLKFSSHHPLKKLKKNLLLNMVWGVVICLLYIVVIAYFKIWQVQLSLIVVLIFSLWALYTAYLQYKKIATTVSSASPLLAELKRHQQSINKWLQTQQKVALVIYPISATGGFMLGGVLGSGKSVTFFLSKPMVLVALLITLLILVPACYYLAKWMCKISFGKHLKALEENIRELEQEK